MRKETKSNDKCHGPIKSNEVLSKEWAKEKFNLKQSRNGIKLRI